MAINNLPQFNNISKFETNLSRIGSGNEVPENIKNYVRDNVVGWLDMTSLGLFLSLVIYFNLIKEFDIYRSALFSSIGVFIVDYAFLVSGFSKDISPLITYGSLILITMIAVYLNKKKGF